MLAQYHVVLEVDPKFKYGPEALNGIYVRSSTGQQVARMADPSVVQTQSKFRLCYKQAYAWTMIEFNFRSRDRLDRLALYKNARGQVGRFRVPMADLHCLSGIRGSEPDCMTRRVSEHDQPHIRDYGCGAIVKKARGASCGDQESCVGRAFGWGSARMFSARMGYSTRGKDLGRANAECGDGSSPDAGGS